jgi:hypothetical protein
MRSISARVVEADDGWCAVLTCVGFRPLLLAPSTSLGPYDSRELALERLDRVLAAVVAFVNMDGDHVDVIRVGAERVVRFTRDLPAPS